MAELVRTSELRLAVSLCATADLRRRHRRRARPKVLRRTRTEIRPKMGPVALYPAAEQTDRGRGQAGRVGYSSRRSRHRRNRRSPRRSNPHQRQRYLAANYQEFTGLSGGQPSFPLDQFRKSAKGIGLSLIYFDPADRGARAIHAGDEAYPSLPWVAAEMAGAPAILRSTNRLDP